VPFQFSACEHQVVIPFVDQREAGRARVVRPRLPETTQVSRPSIRLASADFLHK